MATEQQCSLLLANDYGESKKENLRQEDLAKQLESKEDEDKIEALKHVIGLLLSGQNCSKLLVPVIKFTLRSENHTIKKLLLIYYEVAERYTPGTNKLLPEFILVCNAIRNDLNHPNEYIRGCTLRFLTKIRDPEILEPIIPAINANLEHRHSYVRKNAVLTIFTIYQAHAELVPDAPEMIERFLLAESNLSAKRNAFLMLYHCDQDRAVSYLQSVMDQLPSLGEQFQLVVFELIRKVCRANPLAKSQYVKAVYALVSSGSNAVAYEAANTLIALSSAPTAVRAAIGAYTSLLHSESDNNVRLIILGRLLALKEKHEKLLQESLMDIMRTLASPNIDIRKKTLELVLDLLSARDVEAVVQALRKELVRVENQIANGGSSVDASASPERSYRKLLVDTIYQCAVKFPEVAHAVVAVLMPYVGGGGSAAEAADAAKVAAAGSSKGAAIAQSASMDVVLFLREIAHGYPHLRAGIVRQLLDSFLDIKSPPVYRVALWIIGEYAVEPEAVTRALGVIAQALGALPLAPPRPKTEEEEKAEADAAAAAAAAAAKAAPAKPVAPARSKTVVLADGTYAQQAAIDVSSTAAAAAKEKEKEKEASTTVLRALLLGSNFFLATAVANGITKLLLRMGEQGVHAVATLNQERAKGLQILVALASLGEHPGCERRIDRDSRERVLLCAQALLQPAAFAPTFLERCGETFTSMMDERVRMRPTKKKASAQPVREADDLIVVRQLRKQGAQGDLDDGDDADLKAAIGHTAAPDDLVAKLKTVVQLTGMADAVYAEAFVTVHEYDIVLDIMVLNQTDTTMQNLMIELSTNGDLKIAERPQAYTIAAHDFKKITANIKVSSTENGTIFGNIAYDSTGAAERHVVSMNSIHMDIMDYISPATTTETQFRAMWAEFEWENKVAVNTDIADLEHYMNHIASITNMRVLTPPSALAGQCNFLAANLYATSIFGEDALLNLSVERTPADQIVGYIRIRSKTQGIALSLGDKVQAKQRLPVVRV